MRHEIKDLTAPRRFRSPQFINTRVATRKIKTYVTATLCDRGNTAAAVELLVAADFGDPMAAVANVT